MKTDNDIYDKQLKELFGKMHRVDPSIGFTENLLSKIEKETKKEKRKNQWITIGSAAAGVIGILLIPGLTFYWGAFFIPGFSSPKMNIHFDPIIVAIGFSVLLLLIADILVRKHFHSE
jgi:O-antigen/teichoic acid export membrane protein